LPLWIETGAAIAALSLLVQVAKRFDLAQVRLLLFVTTCWASGSVSV